MLQHDEATTDIPKIDPLSLAYEVQGISPWRQNLSRRVMRSFVGFWGFVAAHWLLLLNVVNAFCLAAAFAAPLLALAGFDGPANVLFGLFHYVCVQNPHHSFYIGDRQMCLCQRCMAIYGGMLIAGLLFMLVRRHARPLKFWQFVAFCLPIAVDSLTQLVGWRESSWELRFVTGGLFAVGLVWSLYPTMQTKMGRLQIWANREQPSL